MGLLRWVDGHAEVGGWACLGGWMDMLRWVGGTAEVCRRGC